MADSHALLIKNVKVFAENDVLSSGYLLLDNGKIEEIGKTGDMDITKLDEDITIIDGAGLNAIPGFIDGHIHGANGADVMDATSEALDTMASILPYEGTTSFLATTITQSANNIHKALANIAEYENKQGYAEIIGVHLEGPFIEEDKAGAQPKEHILTPEVEQFEKWQRISGHRIKTVTMAPEKDEDGALIQYLASHGINVSAGHTAAGIEEMRKAVEYGVSQVTHICNAMSPIHHRDIGVVGAALTLKELRSELIADKIHVSPEMIDFIYENIGSERLILITDALRAKCLTPGKYDLGGQEATVTEDRATLSDGTLAGSILKMYKGAQNMLEITDATLRDVINMAAVNPARQVNVFDRKGSLAPGKDADILLVDDQVQIKYTFCRGVMAFKEDKHEDRTSGKLPGNE
ncbi:N-acetylglucosamine-6-phosphate deacetylase [Sediminibacillus albus]|uniref:N-acetylglucosamine-6-phosphate deacetylase n=1 Tax=Sediminibacillus albus TaxID=407036 RepID=A0A1G8YLM6_9BACI|nr:N-acetylglucosamine-6-phosphate deacetylase [Sediminibacillus albus]SDK03671.1 N-acetylglucosamine-6-phosphate deacetylase [Sediminibacillus albus]